MSASRRPKSTTLKSIAGHGVELVPAIGLVQRGRDAEAADVEVVQDVGAAP